MQGIVKKGPRLQFRQAEEKDLDYILEVEFRPENGKFVIPWEREVHSQTLNTEGAIHLVIERIDTLEPVGFLMIAGLNNPSKEIEWTRIILDKKGEGYGHETLKLLKSWINETPFPFTVFATITVGCLFTVLALSRAFMISS